MMMKNKCHMAKTINCQSQTQRLHVVLTTVFVDVVFIFSFVFLVFIFTVVLSFYVISVFVTRKPN